MKARRPALDDLRNQPAYTLGEAARYLKLPPATLRSWVVGRDYPTAKGPGQFRPVIRPAQSKPAVLSFWNLIEAHVLRALRVEHAVALKAVRTAVQFAERELDLDRLLLRPELRSRGGELFIERYGQLINVSASGQLAMKELLDAHLRRVEWDAQRNPYRLHPFLATEVTSDDMPVVIDAAIAFGRPILVRHGISTFAITERVDAGESIDEIAADYGLEAAEVRTAVLYERAA